MAVPALRTDYEAVLLNSFQHNGEKKWKRTFIGKLVPDSDNNGQDDGYTLYIPEGLAISGRVRIQPMLERSEQTPAPDAS